MSSTSKGSRWLLGAIAVLSLLCALTAASAWWWLQRPLPLAAASVELSIEPGTAPRDVANGWVAAGVQAHPGLLYQWFRWSGQARRIRAGSYEVEAGITPRLLLAKMVQGDETLEKLRLLEGWTWRQVRAALAAAPNLKPSSQALSDAQLMQTLGDTISTSAEGRFFPDTYVYSRGVSDLAVLRRAHSSMQRRLDAEEPGTGIDPGLDRGKRDGAEG
jgi:UPF0755 protein